MKGVAAHIPPGIVEVANLHEGRATTSYKRLTALRPQLGGKDQDRNSPRQLEQLWSVR